MRKNVLTENGFWTVAVTLAALVSLGGCKSAPALVGSESVTIRPVAEMPAPTIATGGFGESSGVGPLDQLRIEVLGAPDLSRELEVDGNSQIMVPLAGTIDVAGRSTSEVAAQIADRLSPYMRNPRVTVNLKESKSRTVSIDGGVREPGLYPLLGDMTLMRVVAAARGLSEFAKSEEVVLFRTVGGRRYAALYNLAAIRQGVYEDPRVYPNDTIVVGTSRARQVFKDLLTASAGITAPLVALLNTN